MPRCAVSALTLIAWLVAGVPASGQTGDPNEGRRQFKPCAVCHSFKPGEDRFGPSLAGVFGRKAAAVEGFPYSPALKASGLVWDESTLARWIEAPTLMVPGSAMNFPGIADARARADVIAYMREASGRAR